MANNISGSIGYIFSTIKSSFLPAFFFLCALIAYYAENPYTADISFTLHYSLFLICFLAVGLLYLAKQSKPLFSLLLGICSYMFINNLKLKYGAEYVNGYEFRCLCFALPLNFVLLYFLPQSKLLTSRNLYILLFILTQIVILEHYGHLINELPYIDVLLEAVPLCFCAFWIMLFMPLAINISFKNTIINTGLFYADSCLFMGLIYSQSATGLTTFYLGFVSILFCVTIIDLYNRYHYDVLENVNSKNSYNNHAANRFPFKYTIAIFSIDNRDKLLQVIGTKKMLVLEQMLVDKIMEMPYELTLYRYNEDELIMVFYDDARHTKEFVENIRHNIAATEFIFSNNKSLKITISLCISEKTRKDLYASEVTERAHNALHKNHRFNCNITTVV